MSTTVRDLRQHGLLVTDERGGVAVLSPRGWTPIPEPLANLVLRALEGDDAATD